MKQQSHSIRRETKASETVHSPGATKDPGITASKSRITPSPYFAVSSPQPQPGEVDKVTTESAQIIRSVLNTGGRATLAISGNPRSGVSQGYFFSDPATAVAQVENLPTCCVKLMPSTPPEAVFRALSCVRCAASQVLEGMPVPGKGSVVQTYVRDQRGPAVGGTRRHDDNIGVFPTDRINIGKLSTPTMLVPSGILNAFTAVIEIGKEQILNAWDVPQGQGMAPRGASQWVGVASAARRHAGVFLVSARALRVPEKLRAYVREAAAALTVDPRSPKCSDLFTQICQNNLVVELLPAIYCPGGAECIEQGLFSDLGNSCLERAPGVFTRRLSGMDKESAHLLSLLPVLYTMEEATSFLQMAFSTESVPGLAQIAVSQFGRPQTTCSPHRVFVGTQTRDEIPHYEPFSSFRSHVIILGRPNVGKSNTIQFFMKNFLQHRAKVLVLDVIKGEHTAFIQSAGGRVWDLTSPLLNLLIPEETEFVDQCINRLGKMFTSYHAANKVGFDGWRALLMSCYEASIAAATGRSPSKEQLLRLRGIDLRRNPAAIPTIDQIVALGKKFVWESIQTNGANRNREKASYFDDAIDAIAGSRLRYMLSGDNSAAEALFDGNAAVNLEQFNDENLKRAVFTGLLEALRERRKAQYAAGLRPCHFTVLDEAHNVLPAVVRNDGGSEIISSGQELSDQMCRSLMELRGYGESFVLASQSPSGLAPTVLRTAGVTVCMALQEGGDRTRVQQALSLSLSQTGALSGLAQGEAIIGIEGRTPYQTRFPLMEMFDFKTTKGNTR